MASTVDAAARYRKADWLTKVRSHTSGPVAILFLVMLACCVVASLILQEQFRFLLPGNLSLLLRQIPNLGIVALGVGILMIAGEFDLSAGSTFVAAPFAMAVFYDAGVPFWLAFLIAIAIAVGIGLVNAGITLYFRIPSFITTLGTLFIVRTAAPYVVDLYGGRKSLPFRPPELVKEVLTIDLFGFLPVQFVWFLVLGFIAYLLLNRHFLGNHFFAAGGDRKSAQFAGINVIRTKTWAFVICSVFATISGIFTITRVAVAQTNPQLFIELYAVAICVIGGLSLLGGRGSVMGILIGACVLQVVQDIILLAQLPGFYLDMFVGMMIVFGVVMNQAIKRKY
jgi:simple sugar transport system permease protein